MVIAVPGAAVTALPAPFRPASALLCAGTHTLLLVPMLLPLALAAFSNAPFSRAAFSSLPAWFLANLSLFTVLLSKLAPLAG